MLNPSATLISQPSAARAWKKNPVEKPHEPACAICGITTLPDCSALSPHRAVTLLTGAVTPVLMGPCEFAYLSSKRYPPDARTVNFDRSCCIGKPQSAYRATPSMTLAVLLSFGVRPPATSADIAMSPASGTHISRLGREASLVSSNRCDRE